MNEDERLVLVFYLYVINILDIVWLIIIVFSNILDLF